MILRPERQSTDRKFTWVFKDLQKRRVRGLVSRKRRVEYLGRYTHVQGAVSGLTISVSMACLSVCVSICLSFKSPLMKFHPCSSLCSCWHVCVSLHSFSQGPLREISMSLSPGVKSATESAETLSLRPYAQSRVWTGPRWAACSYLSLRSICGGWPFQTRATKAPGASAIQPFFSPQYPPPPPLNPFLSVLWGQGCFPCISVCFLVFALSCFHLSLCQSLYLALKRVAESVSASSTLYGVNSHPAGVHRR